MTGARPGSRKWQLERLKVGESALFFGKPGELASQLQARIASCYRAGQSMSQQGLAQSSGLALFEGELATPIVKVTRVAEPKP